MSRVSLNAQHPQIELLFAVERDIVVGPDEVRERAMRRARALLPRKPWVRPVSHWPSPRRLGIGKVAAAAVMLSTLCAVAFYAGYQAKNQAEPEAAPAKPSVVVPPVSSAPPVTSPVGSSPPAKPPPAISEPRPAKAKHIVSEKPVTESEAYAMELRVLKPAQGAVAHGDFVAALAAVAEHRRQFPSGRLAEEREALRVRALLGLGRGTEAQRAGAAFRKRFPRSALRGRMDEMLGTRK
jgi:hypothetical protein